MTFRKYTLIKAIICIIVLLACTASYAASETEGAVINEHNEGKKSIGLSAASPHAILLDMNNGHILYKKNADDKVYPASLTKIMTAVLALENGNLEDVVEASDSAISSVSEGSSNMSIRVGERLSIRQLLYGMLLSSAADAANIIAEYIGGDMEKFVLMMNEKASELKMNSTNFINPTGDHDERHYSTTEDMAKLAEYAMKIPEFKDIVKCDSYTIPATAKYPDARTLTNGNHLISRLRRGDYYYKYATGIKTGYTSQAKSCLAASAEKNGIQLLALVFGANTEDGQAMSFVDCRGMFDYVFNNYRSETAVESGKIVAQTKIKNSRRTKKVLLKTEEAVVYLYDKNSESGELSHKDDIKEEISAPVKEGEPLGIREYFVDGVSVGRTVLVADKNYRFDLLSFFANGIYRFITSIWMIFIAVILIVMLIYAERRRRSILRARKRKKRKHKSAIIERKIKSINEENNDKF